MIHTEDDLFEVLRRVPMGEHLLDIIEPDVHYGMDAFIENINSGAYDNNIIQCGWTRKSFKKAYYEKYVYRR